VQAQGVDQPRRRGVLEGARHWLAGYEMRDWRWLAAEFRGRGGAWCGSAQCAFEMAFTASERHGREITAF
jgi:hypothetical protein